MFTSIHSPASSTLSVSSGEPDYPTHGLPLWDRYPSFSPLQVRGKAWSPPSSQPEQDMDDIKLPPHVIEHLDNSQLSYGYGVYDDPTKLHTFRQRQLEQMVGHFRSERLEQEKKLKYQEKLIEGLQSKGKMVEKKVRAQEKKLEGYRYRIGKRYNTRSGKK
jgi:hypothetical protein